VTRAFTISGVRVDHHSAPLAVLEAVSHAEPAKRLEVLAAADGVEEAFLLQTCNRVEEYVVSKTAAAGEAVLADLQADVSDEHVVTTEHEPSLRHLLRVSAGLESQVLGEDHILGQVRSAYRTAERAGAIGPVLEAALLKAIHVGERARTETAINEGTVSLGSAAIQLAQRDHHLPMETALVVGAGEMATVTTKGLVTAGIEELRLLNRTPERAAALAGELGQSVRTDGLDALNGHLSAADLVITSTASDDPVIRAEHVDGVGETRFIDLGQPRDVDRAVADQPRIDVDDLDDLEAITADTHADRQDAAEAVETIVQEEFGLLIDQYKRRRADSVIRGMYQGAEDVKERELDIALSRLGAEGDLTEEQRAAVEGLADALVDQLLAVPTQSLREAAAEDDWATVASAIELFDPSIFDEEPPPELRSLAAEAGEAADASDG